MPDEDPPDDDLSFAGDPVHPDDRIWRHPSELRSVPPHGARSIPDTVDFAPTPSRGTRWGPVVASSLVGASAALIAVLVTGMGERVVDRDPTSITAELSATTLAVSTTVAGQGTEWAIEAVSPSVAQVVVSTSDGAVDGSALVVSADGYLLTDAHALAEAVGVVVTLPDGTSMPADVVAVDEISQLAVLHVQRHDLHPATIGDPSALQVGQIAMTLGRHDGSPSISSGVVSALDGRSTGEAGTPLYGMIRVDAPVPDGVAGGPLVTDAGEVVGLTAKTTDGSTFGWATPIDDASEIAESLIEHGHATYAWLGIEGRRTVEGPVVMVVAEGSPADVAGLAVDDVLLRVDGEPVTSMAALVSIIRDREPGDSISIAYRRGGMEWTCVAVLGQRS